MKMRRIEQKKKRKEKKKERHKKLHTEAPSAKQTHYQIYMLLKH